MTTALARAIEGIPVVGSTTERDQLFVTPQTDQRVHLRSTGEMQRYDGASWVVDLQTYPIHASETSLGVTVVDRRYPYATPERYGAVADCAGPSTAQLAAATDSTVAIQAAWNVAVYGTTGRKCEMLSGGYKCTNTLHLGYGVNNYSSGTVEGKGFRLRGDNRFAGTALFFTQSDRQGVSIQGGRQVRLRGVALIGPLLNYIQTNRLAEDGLSAAVIDDTVAANWIDSSQAATQESRYAPCAGVTIDAFAGAQPATHYPAVTYPAFLGGGIAQYGKNFSSDSLLQDVYIGGFNTAVANQPCDADGNGDFTVLRDCYLEFCKYAVSVGNSQSRNVAFEGVTKITSVYAAFTNNVHGRQIGKFGSFISNVSVFGCIHLVQFGAYYAGPIVIAGLYAEGLWRIGTVVANSTNEQSLVFVGCQFGFHAQTDARGHPASVLDGGTIWDDVQFNGCTFDNYKSVVGITSPGVSFDGSNFRLDAGSAARANPYQQIAHNALAGGLAMFRLGTPDKCRLKLDPYNIDTGVKSGSPQSTRKWAQSSRPYCIPFYADGAAALNEPFDNLVVPIPESLVVAKSSLASLSLTGSTLVFTYTGRSAASFLQFGPSNGDVLWDDQTGSIFFVRSVVGTVVTAELQNNYKVVVATVTPLVAISLSVGNFYFRNARLYTPPFYLRGDCTAATAAISNCARDDGFAAWYDAEISVGDALMVNSRRDNFTSQSGADITARSQAAGTITVSNGAAMRAQTRRRLDFFIRQPPANV